MTIIYSETSNKAQAPDLTLHAATRMQQRGIKRDDVRAALNFGRRIHAKGVTFYVVGHKEVRHYALAGVDLTEVEGLQVLVSDDGSVVTTYRSRDLHSIRATPRAKRRQRLSYFH